MINKIEQAITIVIPSKDRPEKIDMLLNYFSRKMVKSRIIVLESGSSYQNIIVKHAKKLKVELHTFSEDATLGDKIAASAKLVESEIVCLCSDDDLVLTDAMEESAKFLMENPDYSACQGYHGVFDQKENAFHLLNIIWFAPCLNSDKPLQRLRELIHRFHPIFWAVYRKDIFLKICQHIPQVKTPLFLELLISSTAVLYGKIKRLPLLYCIRKNDLLNPLGHPFYLYADSPEDFFKDYINYRKCLENIFNNTILTDMKIRYILDLMHTNFFHESFDRGILSYTIQKLVDDSSASIFDPEIYNVIKCPPSPIIKKKSKKIKYKGKNYCFAKKFLNPEPAYEIPLAKNFHITLMKNHLDYFVVKNSEDINELFENSWETSII